MSAAFIGWLVCVAFVVATWLPFRRELEAERQRKATEAALAEARRRAAGWQGATREAWGKAPQNDRPRVQLDGVHDRLV